MAKEVLKSECDIFEKTYFQNSIESSQFIQYRPIASLSDATTIEFNVPASSEYYIDLENIQLWLSGKITQQDGSDYDSKITTL
jgi:hypothetical protein